MKTIKVNLKERSYRIIVGANIISSLGSRLAQLDIGQDAYVITNAAIKNKFGALLAKELKSSGFSVNFTLVPDTEKSKSIATASSLINRLAAYDQKRRLFIIALGGGVIGDLAGFIASTYKRGVPYIQIPTTLLAQVDSSIGGKTALDLEKGKNLIGSFYQPRLVLSEINFLKTLDLRQFRAGLAEVIKYGIIKDRKLFSYLEQRHTDVLKANPAALEFIVSRSSAIKARIVEEDEKEERGLRTILNFGHTLGHAIEAAVLYKKYNHGEAVALGMLLACDISCSLSMLKEKTAERIEGLIRKAGLPVKIQKVPLRNIINSHYHDKKFIGAKNRFVLIKDIGKTEIKQDIPLEIIKKALKKRII